MYFTPIQYILDLPCKKCYVMHFFEIFCLRKMFSGLFYVQAFRFQIYNSFTNTPPVEPPFGFELHG